MYRLIQGDALAVLPTLADVTCVFADPPDNIGLGYNEFTDKRSDRDYVDWLEQLVCACVAAAPISWFSFNAKWTFAMGRIFESVLARTPGLSAKPCVQVFTFGQHNKFDLGNNHRPLWRLAREDAVLYPENIRVPSWRQRQGDKRAAPQGRVPADTFDMQYPSGPAVSIGNWLSAALDDPSVCPEMKRDIEQWFQTSCGDVCDFPRVTGNSKQRCDWHPTQLHEELVERCIKLSTKLGDHVVDPLAGTGTTLRVCRRIARRCTLVELDHQYCRRIAADNDLQPGGFGWTTREAA